MNQKCIICQKCGEVCYKIPNYIGFRVPFGLCQICIRDFGYINKHINSYLYNNKTILQKCKKIDRSKS